MEGVVCFLGIHGHDCSEHSCPNNCNGHDKGLPSEVCRYVNGYTSINCPTAVCDEECSLHGGVCDNGVSGKRLACWISIQKYDKDGDNRLRACHNSMSVLQLNW